MASLGNHPWIEDEQEPLLAPEAWRPVGDWSPAGPLADSWIEYAAHWLAVVLDADGIEGGHAVYSAVKPIIDGQVPLPGLRMVPDLIRRTRD